MWNFSDSNGSLKRDLEVATGQSVAKEGALLVRVLEAGIQKVQPAAGSSTEIPVGFAVLDNENFSTDVRVESITVPSSGPYVVTLSHADIVGTSPNCEVRVQPASGSDYTQVAGAPAATQFQVSSASAGQITFNSAQAGAVLTVYYRFNLTVAEAALINPGTRSPNNTASAMFKHVTVLSGHGEVYTKEYAANIDFSTGTLKSAAGGLITMGGSGADLSALMHVIKLPSADDATLGLAFNLKV
jgi:hypothetical protein